jgi:hypothetical protein
LRRAPSGRVTCKTADGQSTAASIRWKAKPGRFRFSFRFKSLTLTAPFAPALVVRVTTDPAEAVTGIDRLGILDTCRVTTKAMLCVAKH